MLKYCEIDEDDPGRLQKLREVPVKKLVDAIQGVGIFLHHSYQDENFWPRGFPTHFTEDELIGGCDWVDEIVIGDAFYEVCAFQFSLALKLFTNDLSGLALS